MRWKGVISSPRIIQEKKAEEIGVKDIINPAFPICRKDNVLYQNNRENPQSNPIIKGNIRYSGLNTVIKPSKGKKMK